MIACTGTPISWLRLERFCAGDLPEGDRATVAAHVAACPACAACVTEIETDQRDLPALDANANANANASADANADANANALAPAPAPAPAPALRRLAPLAATLALAAALLLFLSRRPRAVDAPPANRAKGGDVGFVLVRDDGARIDGEQGAFADGDRFEALVTCPPEMRASFDVVVYEHGDASFPLAPAAELACGNAVVLPGALRLTGREPMDVCLVWGEGALDREALRRAGPDALPRALCKHLAPAP